MTHSAVCLLVLAEALAGAQKQQPGRVVNLCSEEKESALGAELANEVRRNNRILDSAPVSDYVERIGRGIAAQLPGDCKFEVILGEHKPIHEPLWLPGGYIFVRSGLLLAAQNESEFAGMLAHAIAHAAERHGVRLATRATLANTTSNPVIYMGALGESEDHLLLPLGFLKFARQFELEADKLAVRLMADAGWDPAALARYIRRLQTEPAVPKIDSPLPDRETRLAGIEEAIRQLPARAYSSSEEFGRVQDEVRRLAGPPARRAPTLRQRR